jgi:transposase
MAWRRGKPYGQDLRDRVLAEGAAPLRAVAARFGVSPSFVSKVRARLRELGEPTPGPQHNHVTPRLAPVMAALRARVAAEPDATVAALRAWALAEHGIGVSHPVMWTALARLGLTLKKSGCARPSRSAPTWPRRGPPGPRQRQGWTRRSSSSSMRPGRRQT